MKKYIRFSVISLLGLLLFVLAVILWADLGKGGPPNCGPTADLGPCNFWPSFWYFGQYAIGNVVGAWILLNVLYGIYLLKNRDGK